MASKAGIRATLRKIETAGLLAPGKGAPPDLTDGDPEKSKAAKRELFALWERSCEAVADEDLGQAVDRFLSEPGQQWYPHPGKVLAYRQATPTEAPARRTDRLQALTDEGRRELDRLSRSILERGRAAPWDWYVWQDAGILADLLRITGHRPALEAR